MRQKVLWKVAWLLLLLPCRWAWSFGGCCICVVAATTTILPMLAAVLATHQQGRKCAAIFACHQITRSLAFAHWKPKRCFQQEKSVMKNNKWQHFSLAVSSNNDAAVADNDAAAADSFSNNNNDLELETIQDAIFELTNGRPINLNSPKQVSNAIFGTTQSTSREVLLMAAQGKIAQLDETSRKLAGLVLEYRQLVVSKAATAAAAKTTTTTVLPSIALSKPVTTTTPFRKSRSFSSATLNSVEEEENALDINGDLKIATTAATTNTTTATFVSPYEIQVESLFTTSPPKKCKIHDYWKEPLLQLTRPSARSLVSQLNAKICPNGYDPLAMMTNFMDPLRSSSSGSCNSGITSMAGKKGSFLAFCREQKEKYPDCIILTRCGDFYETFGIDAIMLVEHCGLNPMGNKAKAGCPIRNVQATIDCLTEQGFRVAVYEEAPDTDASVGARAAGGSKSRIKSRFLAQIVSSASPTYLYDLILLGNSDSLATAQPSSPYVGVLSLAAGYTLVEVSIEERSVRVSSRLTAEAVSARLAAFPPADPMFYVPSPIEFESLNGGTSLSLPFLPSRRDISMDGPGARLRTKIIPPTLVPGVTANVDDVERAKTTIVSAILQVTENQDEEETLSSTITSKRRASVEDFTLVSSQTMSNIMTNEKAVATSPLHVETATQLGLMNDRAIPSLIAHILPNSAPAATNRFLRRFLLTPPPPVVGDAMGVLVLCLKNQGPALPPLTVPAIGKILSLLRAGQASAQVYGELMQSMSSALLLLDELSNTNPKAVEALMTLLEYESGLAAEPTSLRKRCHEALETISSVVSPLHHAQGGAGQWDEDDHNNAINDCISCFGNIIPQSFLERNEVTWRGRIRPHAAAAAYGAVEKAARRLAKAVAVDFWILPNSPDVDWEKLSSGRKNPIVQDIFDNLVAIKQIPDGRSDKTEYKHPRDRFGKVLRNRYTTESVEEALSSYVEACESAKRDVASALSDLSVQLHDEHHIPAIVQAAHINLIVSAAFHHAARAATMGWNMARTSNDDETDYPTENPVALHLEQLYPYWMNREESVANTIRMDGLFLLTAPNMSGKSTLMRSTAAAALLSVCGLCAPIGTGSFVKRFDHIFVRGASADVPSEQKSAFGAEMEDVASLLRSCGNKSLVFVDELGRGTSPRDGTRLAGAVLEALSMKGMNGIFATHLHDILALPLKGSDRIKTKRMAIHDEQRDHESAERSMSYSWTYRLEDGVCRDSMALITAAKFGLPIEVLSRAEALGSYLPEAINSSGDDDINGVALWPVNGAQEVNGDRNGLVMEMKSTEIAQSVLKDVTGQQIATIPALWNVPPALAEGTSCVYMLQLDDNAQQQPRFYVGETDNLRQRIQQHRRKKGRGLNWKHASALVVQAPGKSQARTWESLVIRRLAQAGLSLVSTSDGRRSTRTTAP